MRTDGCEVYSHKILPAVLDDSLSYYELVESLRVRVSQLIELYESMKETYVTLEEFNKSQSEQDKAFVLRLQTAVEQLSSYIDSEVARLEFLISEAIAGKITVFDPTYGIKPRRVDHVIRNVYHWLRYYADDAGTLDVLALTADERDSKALDAREFDLYSMRYYSHDTPNIPYSLEDYVRKYEISASFFNPKEEPNV